MANKINIFWAICTWLEKWILIELLDILNTFSPIKYIHTGERCLPVQKSMLNTEERGTRASDIMNPCEQMDASKNITFPCSR